MKTVILEVNTWIGISGGASHYVGNLRRSNGDKETLFRKLTTAGAIRMNKAEKNIWPSDDPFWRKGMTTARFESENDLFE